MHPPHDEATVRVWGCRDHPPADPTPVCDRNNPRACDNHLYLQSDAMRPRSGHDTSSVQHCCCIQLKGYIPRLSCEAVSTSSKPGHAFQAPWTDCDELLPSIVAFSVPFGTDSWIGISPELRVDCHVPYRLQHSLLSHSGRCLKLRVSSPMAVSEALKAHAAIVFQSSNSALRCSHSRT